VYSITDRSNARPPISSYLYSSACVNARFGDARLIHNRLPACYPNAPILEKGSENDIGSLLVKQFDHDYAGWL
jgi:hypothetical protein